MEKKHNDEILIEEKEKIKEKKHKDEENIGNKKMENVKETNDMSDKNLEENNDEYAKKSNKGQTLQDKLVKLYIEKETKKYKYNIVDLPENLKYSSDNSEGSTSQRTKNNKNKDNNGYTNTKKDKKDINNDTNRNDKHDKSSQKEESIKDNDNEKENHKNTNIINSINNEKEFSFRNKKPFLNEVKSRTYSMDDDFGDKTDKNNNKISKTKIEEKTKEYEEEKNRKLYKLLLLKNLNISTKRYGNETNEESNNKREKSSTNRISSSKEKEAKDGALKIMELIKAKKTEKNVIDKIEKEAQEAFKRAKTPLNKNVEYSPTFLTKDKGSIFNTSDKNTNVERITKNENNNEKKENEVKTIEPKRECTRKIYKRIKHRSSLMDSMHLNSKDENTLNNNFIIPKNDERINTDNEKVEIKKKINVNKRPYNNNKYINDLEFNSSKHPKISLKKRINPQEIGSNIYYKNNTINIDDNINDNVINEFRTERLMKDKSHKNIFEENNNSNSNNNNDESNTINSNSNMVNRIYKISNNNIKSKNSLNIPAQENKKFKKNIDYSNNNVSNKFQNLNKSSSCFTNVIRNQYKEIKTYQKPKQSIDTSLSINQSQPHINKVYEPKKCIKLHKAKDRFSPKNELKYLNEQNYVKKDKITYIKKNPSKKKERFHHLNKSLGNLNSEINNYNDYYTNKIINNREKTENISNINNGVEYSTRNNIYSKYNTENTIEETNFNKFSTIQEGMNYHKFTRFNPTYYNTFYMRNHSETNNINNNINLYKINNIFNNTFGTFNSGLKNEVSTKVDSYRSKLKISKNNIFDTQSPNYKSTTNININNNSPLNIKYEDLLLLEDRLNNIIFSLNEERSISNECFDYWNLFFNCSLYENLEQILSSFDSEIKNLIKISLNYNLMSIIVSYNISFDKEVLNRIRPLLSEMLELCNKLLIIIFEYIINISKINYNIWIKKINNLIQNLKSYDDSDTMLISSGQNKLSQKDKMNYNINFLMQKIYYILSNYPSSSSTLLINMFKKIKAKTYDEINDFFRENILREKGLKYSILATTFLRSGETLSNKPAPYLTYRSPKKYTLVLDIDETLFHFRINEENDEQGVLKIRPGVFQFIDEIKEYYEIILFSEAERGYIDLLTEAIGENRYLYDCVLCRDYISIVGKDFVKDLNKIGRSLDRVIIVDNMPQNFYLHKENAIYIKSFWGVENDDKALIDLIPILISISKSGRDVRKELVKYKEKIVTKISSNIYKHSNL